MSKIEQRLPIKIDKLDDLPVVLTATEKRLHQVFAGKEKNSRNEATTDHFLVQLNPEAKKFLQQNKKFDAKKIVINEKDAEKVTAWQLGCLNLQLSLEQTEFLKKIIYAITQGQSPTQLKDIYPYSYQFTIENWSWLKNISQQLNSAA
ncbi:MAG: hypothetical protein Q4G02_03710 [bacterium]|nr:hypothetical protein [bacterium]